MNWLCKLFLFLSWHFGIVFYFISRYHFFLQLLRDLIEKRLPLPHSSAVLLASYAVQCEHFFISNISTFSFSQLSLSSIDFFAAELGDYSSEDHKSDYLANIQLLPNQTGDIEREISELHKLHRGQTPADAELNFLEHAKTLDFYGIELHKAKVQN